MSRGKSAGLFTGEGDKKRGVVIEDRHDGNFGIMMISPTTHEIDCHFKVYPSHVKMERFLYDLAWALDYEVMSVAGRQNMFARERETERKLAKARKEIRELKKS